ncbi:UNVERIFIED_ORG: hypothetical protein M2438_001895 [Methylobacterium sp. SuP10 SLI 274]|uniref:hypothetical protein n=1 Tax=Methylorubrum extorquens TaxID=408 RepID=UPI00209E8511|nr:hypothetical protein [Methylorubrum extorquens]MDF9863108.1 hypothetical protein [Methylorubrum pseudosasae]MDH6636720.1 hypothetical protein [Methylobacterium sp. SuP10 SLI 274]MDH6665897.1 hypothetical protein [Methylorubrum zatmanii]MCP1557811.1 hypothetical protein [Methylorubrum extorquens]MDF9791413.1 hypothetical protein [Methylorubrum extorquens]
MLNPADLADWDKLSAGLLALSARRALASRQGERMLQQQFAPVGVDEHRIAPHDFPAVEEDLGEMDRESALLAQTAHALALVRRLARDEQSGRPAPVAADAEPRSPSARSLLARAITALTGAPAKGSAA